MKKLQLFIEKAIEIEWVIGYNRDNLCFFEGLPVGEKKELLLFSRF